MKKTVLTSGVFFIALVLLLGACKKSAGVSQDLNAIPQEILAKIASLGFGTSNVTKIDEGYLVEGDIIISDDQLNHQPNQQLLRIANEEQYHTTNLVKGLPRVISVRVDASLSTPYLVAADSMISRYNALGLSITFERVATGGHIVLKAAPKGSQYLASAGFPTTGGEPYNTVLVNRRYLDSWNSNTVVSILAHEVGHCIGFRHTDYMSRQYSCGGAATNEGTSSVGAIQITGTPSGPDDKSWMLACIGDKMDRPFNKNDLIALNFLY